MSDADGIRSGSARRVGPVSRITYDIGILIVTIGAGVFAAFMAVGVPWRRWTWDQVWRRTLSLNPDAADRLSDYNKAVILPDAWSMKLLALATTPLSVAMGLFVGLLVGKMMAAYAGRRVDALAESLLSKRSDWAMRTDLDLLLPGPWLVSVPAPFIAASAGEGPPVIAFYYLLPFVCGYYFSMIALRPIYRMIIARADEIAAAEAAAAAQKA